MKMMANKFFLRSSRLFLSKVSRNHVKSGTKALSTKAVGNENNGLVITNVHEDTGVAVLMMNRPPANSMSLEMNEAISNSIKTIESNPKIQSVIIASSKPTIFSAGLDIAELVAPDSERLPRFWTSMQQVCIDLYGSRLATIAALQGHSIAGGCMIAMACDYRVMYAGDTQTEEGKKKHVPTIGLNETKLGIAAPPWMGQLMVNTIGHRPAERALALGTLFQPKEALQIGLVDSVVGDQTNDSVEDGSDGALRELLPTSLHDQIGDAVMQHAFREAVVYAKIPPQARVASKQITRSHFLKGMEDKREVDNEYFCGFIGHELVQKNLMAYVDALKKRSKK